MRQYLFPIYLLNSLLIFIICLINLPRKKFDKFSVYGVGITAYPACLTELIQLYGAELPELYLMGILWIPIAILGLNLMISSGPTFFRPAVLLLMAPSAIGLLNGLLLNQTTLYPLMFLILTIPFIRSYHKVDYLTTIKQIVFLAIMFRVFVHILVLFLQDLPNVGDCRQDKCSVFGAVLTPFGTQSNQLSMTYSLIAAYLLTFVKGRIFALATVALIVNTEISGGRTGLLSLVSVILCVLITKRYKVVKRFDFACMTLFPALILSCAPLFLNFSDNSFTGRAYLWDWAKHEIMNHPILGVGPSFWVRLSETTSSSSFYSAHNIWLELSISTGLISAILFSLGFISIFFSVPLWRVSFVTPILVSFLVSGAFEVPVLPYRLVQNPGFYFLLLYSTSFMHKKINIGTEKSDQI